MGGRRGEGVEGEREGEEKRRKGFPLIKRSRGLEVNKREGRRARSFIPQLCSTLLPSFKLELSTFPSKDASQKDSLSLYLFGKQQTFHQDGETLQLCTSLRHLVLPFLRPRPDLLGRRFVRTPSIYTQDALPRL